MRSTFAGQRIPAGYCGPATTNGSPVLPQRRLDKQPLQYGLTVVAVSAEIAESPAAGVSGSKP